VGDEPSSIVARPMTPLAAAGWSVVFFLLGPVAVGLTEAARPGAHSDIVNEGACVVLAASLTIFAIVRVHAPEASLRKTLGLAAIGPLQAVLSIVAGLGLQPIISTVNERIIARWPYSDEERQLVESLYRAPTFPARLALVVVAVVVVPVTLELFFRGVLFGALARTTTVRVAAAASAFCFAGSQGDARSFPTAFLVGLAMARLRDQTGSVVSPLLATLAFGAVDGIPVLRGQDPAVDTVYPVTWVLGGAVLAVLALAFVGSVRKAHEE
jgi:uncharacterized protein